ncbi:alpha/beta hydrolase [Spirosoma profusum]|nr:alpha/beta hydrolase [Spirosoma profusum]
MKQLTIALAVFVQIAGQAFSQGLSSRTEKAEYLTFTLSDKVTKQNVQYKNRYGITVASHLYMPKNMDTSKKYPAVVIGTPYGGVKEQGAGIYAQNMAERGFIALAIDESYNGESGGENRHISSPDVFTEDFSAGVDFLGTRPFIDRAKIGAIGICGSGGFALKAAQVDHRIKAVATTSMYDMSGVMRNGWKNSMSADERNKTLDQLGEQRWKDFEAGKPELPPSFPSQPVTTIPAGLDPIASEFFEYYAMKRGFHPNSIGAFTKTSSMAFMNFPLLNYIETISPRPILFIMGENAHSRYFSEDAYKQAAEPKEIYIVPKACHIDLYDRVEMIPFDKLTSFFTQYLTEAKLSDKATVIGNNH